MSVSSENPISADKTTGQFFEEGMFQYVCTQCSAAVITDKSTVMMFCAFCGSPTVVEERLVGARKPEGIIPFKVGRAEAIKAFFRWCKAGRFTPIGFMKESHVEKLTGIFVPVWLLDCDTDMDFAAKASTVSYITSGGRKSNQTTKTASIYKIVRKRKLRFEKIQLSGATRINDKLIEDVEPYDVSATEGFDMKYIAGFFAEKSDQTPEDLEEKLNMKIKKNHESIFNGSVEKYTSVTDVVDESVNHKPEVRHALLPIWTLNYKYLGRTNTFAMNGQTGKIAGEPPISIFKLLLLGLVFLPVFMVICGFFGKWIMGGLWGSPLFVMDVLYIAVSLIFTAILLFIVFRLKKRKTNDCLIAYVDPVSSEIIEEKDQFLYRTSSVTDTTKISELLDGENRIRGCGEFLSKGGHLSGGCGAYNESSEKVDSDGNRI